MVIQKEVWKEEQKKHYSRRLSIKEGMTWSIRKSFGDSYVSPFAVAIGSADWIVAIINSLWNLSFSGQLIGAKLLKKFHRKKVLTRAVTVDALSWLFLFMIGIFYLTDTFSPFLPYLIILALSSVVIAGGIGHPAWFSIMGDIVDEKYRGRWYAKRETLIAFSTIILGISSSFLLQYLKEINYEFVGFTLFFLIAFIGRISCVSMLNKHYAPQRKQNKEIDYSFKNFFKEAKKTNFGKFCLFRAMFAFAVTISSSLIAVYLLRHVGLSYPTYILATFSGTFFSIITLNLWGKISDKYGNYVTIAITTTFIPLTPLLWIASQNPVYLMIIPGLIGGTAWSAFIVASSNFIYDNIPKGKRGKSISYYNSLVGIGALLGGLVSATLIKTINTSWIAPIYLIFIIGASLRMITVFYWMIKIKEVTKKRKLKNIRELKDLVIKEVRPTLVEDIHEIASIKKYINTK